MKNDAGFNREGKQELDKEADHTKVDVVA